MGEPSKEEVKDYMYSQIPECMDSAGVIVATQLAEAAAYYFDCEEWLADETHWVWDIAADVAGEA